MIRLKAIFAAILGFAATVFYALRQRDRANQAEAKAEREKAAREYENAGSEALIGGLGKEQEVKRETIDTRTRSHFE